MKEFDVTITETLKLTVSVEASSKEEAQHKRTHIGTKVSAGRKQML